MWARTLKAWYFPYSSFFDAKLRSRASWAWASLLVGWDILNAGTHWKILNAKILDFGLIAGCLRFLLVILFPDVIIILLWIRRFPPLFSKVPKLRTSTSYVRSFWRRRSMLFLPPLWGVFITKIGWFRQRRNVASTRLGQVTIGFTLQGWGWGLLSLW